MMSANFGALFVSISSSPSSHRHRWRAMGSKQSWCRLLHLVSRLFVSLLWEFFARARDGVREHNNEWKNFMLKSIKLVGGVLAGRVAPVAISEKQKIKCVKSDALSSMEEKKTVAKWAELSNNNKIQSLASKFASHSFGIFGWHGSFTLLDIYAIISMYTQNSAGWRRWTLHDTTQGDVYRLDEIELYSFPVKMTVNKRRSVSRTAKQTMTLRIATSGIRTECQLETNCESSQKHLRFLLRK